MLKQVQHDAWLKGVVVQTDVIPNNVIPNLFRDLMRKASNVDCGTALADAETSSA